MSDSCRFRFVSPPWFGVDDEDAFCEVVAVPGAVFPTVRFCCGRRLAAATTFALKLFICC